MSEQTPGGWPDPAPEMLDGNPLFDAIWNVVKRWDVNVPGVYVGYMGATGNHARAIYDAINAEVAAQVAAAERRGIERAITVCRTAAMALANDHSGDGPAARAAATLIEERISALLTEARDA